MGQPKPPSQKTLKAFFKLLSLDLAAKAKAELVAGLDPNVQFDLNGFGAQTALMYALDRDKRQCVRMLLDAKADVNARGERGGTALHEVNDVGFAKDLLARGAEINAKTKTGDTPLHMAAAGDNADLVAVLLEHGADVDAANSEGKTPYGMARKVEVRVLLKQHGAKGFGPGGGKLVKPTKVAKTTWGELALESGCIGADRDGNVWFASNSGLFRFDGKAVTSYEFEESWSYDSLGAGPPGVLYIATNWGLLEYKADKFRLYSSEDSELFDNHLTYLKTSPDGRAYMLHYESEAEEKHISVFDGSTFQVLTPGKEFPAGLDITCLGFDHDGELVIGADSGLAVRKADKWKVFQEFSNGYDERVHEVASDGDTLWVGTTSGLWKYRDGKLTRQDPEEPVKCVCMAGDSVWVAIGAGLGQIRAGALTIQTPANSALPADDEIEQLAAGQDGTLWIRAGGDLARVRDGKIERLTGEAPPDPEPVKPKKLLAFPKAIVARKLVPKPVVDAVQEAGLEGIAADRVIDLLRPAIAFDLLKYKSLPVGASKFGGQPDLPAKLKWPTYADDEDRMLPFVLQLDLAALHGHDKEGLLPKKGMLYFFSDTAPDELEDGRVLYTEQPIEKLVRRPFPEDLVDRVKQADFIAQLPEYKIELTPVFTLPPLAFLRDRAVLTDDDEQTLQTLAATVIKLANKKLPAQCSRLLGWPDSLQGEVVESVDHIALLQLNGYELSPKGIEKVFEHWCGDGLIHFLITRADLEKQKFDRATATMAYT